MLPLREPVSRRTPDVPIWPVTIKDGLVQVRDADGDDFPVLRDHQPLGGLPVGWSPIGLQTGLPLHLLELRHEDGETGFWLLDHSLTVVGETVDALPPDHRVALMSGLEPLVRNLHEEAVVAPHAAVPSAAHEFKGLQPATVLTLITELVSSGTGRPHVLSADQLAELGASYGQEPFALSAERIRDTLGTSLDPASRALLLPSPVDGMPSWSQERLALPGHVAWRFLFPERTLVAYLIVPERGAARHLYVPAVRAIFTEGAPSQVPDLLSMLLAFYATHVDRAVILPELDGIGYGLETPAFAPQAGLDEPPPAPEAEAPYEPGSAHLGVPAEAPAAEPGAEQAPEPAPEPATDWLGTVTQRVEPMAAPHAPAAADDGPEAGRKQGWWQRMLGLGNGS